MKPSLIRAACAALLWATVLAPAGAAGLTATVTAVTGKVQVQKGSAWTNLTVGQSLDLGSTVATGFRSELKLKIGPSTVTVKALSRLTIESLVQNGTDASTELYLKVGKVSAEVNKDEVVQTQKFTVKSPVATASVRGTAFSFDGVHLEVLRGVVDFIDSRGEKLAVLRGESARAGLPGSGQPTRGNADLVLEASVTQVLASRLDESQGTLRDLLSEILDGSPASKTIEDWLQELPNTYVVVGGITE